MQLLSQRRPVDSGTTEPPFRPWAGTGFSEVFDLKPTSWV